MISVRCGWPLLTVLLYFLLNLFSQTDAKNVSSKGPMLLRLVPRTTEQLDFLNSLKKKDRSQLKLQVWRHPDKINQHVDMWLAQSSFQQFTKLCIDRNLSYEVITKDINENLGETNISMKNIEQFDQFYQAYDEIVGELKRLAIIFRDQATLSVIGQTYENRNIYAIKILFDQFYDERIEETLKTNDLIFTPLLNPDGYITSKRRRFRLWRKSRSREIDRACVGVDLNRNFDYRWGGGGSSPDLCDETYCGRKPFSEKESLALARYLYQLRRNLVAYLDIHTFGQLWMSPWGFTNAAPKDYDKHINTMKKIQTALRHQAGSRYKIGRLSLMLYHTSGDAIDWVYGRLGILHTYGVELRPLLTNKYGFQHHRRAIIPTGTDLFVGITALAKAMIEDENVKI